MTSKKDNNNSNPSKSKAIVRSPSVDKDLGFAMMLEKNIPTPSERAKGLKATRKSGSHGKGMIKKAVSVPTVSRMPAFYYHPLYEESNIMLPREPKEINQWCFVPETKVLMRDGTEKRIDEIKIGEQVITHTGSVGQVTNVWDREIDEDIYNINSLGNDDLLVTGNHEIFRYKKDKIECRYSYIGKQHLSKSRCLPQKFNRCSKYGCNIDKLDNYEKNRIIELEIGDCLFTPIYIYKKYNDFFTKDFLRLLGYYVAEGSIDFSTLKGKKYEKGIRFVINQNERETLGKEINELCNRVFGKETAFYDYGTALHIRLGLASAARIMMKYGGHLAKNKKLSKEIIELPTEYQVELLETMMMGDGHIIDGIENKKKNGRIIYTTASIDLANQIKFMLDRCGVVCGFKEEKRIDNISYKKIDGKYIIDRSDNSKFKEYIHYLITIYPNDSKKLFPNLIKSCIDKKLNLKYRFIYDDKIITPIRSIERKHYKGKVYNLEVYNVDIDDRGNEILRKENNDHSYVANKVAVANSRHFYRTDPIVGTAIDFHAEYPLTAMNLKMPKGESDPYIEKYFNELFFDKLYMPEICQYISHEYHILGNVFPFGEWDESEGSWTRFVLLNPDYVHIKSNIFAGEPELEMSPDSRLEQIINSRQPRDIFDKIPGELIQRIMRGQRIPLSPKSASHLFRKLNFYDEYGTPMMYRLFKILMYKDKLREAQFAIAERHITPLQIWKIGTEQNPANDDDISYFQKILADVYSDRNAAIVYGHYLEYQVIGSSGQIAPLNTEFDYIEKEILFGMGLSVNIITGEGAQFQQPYTALEALVRKFSMFRTVLSKWIESKVLKPVAESQGFYKTDPTTGEEYLIYPKVEWTKMSLKDDQNQKNMILQLRQQGILSVKSVLPLYDFNYDTEKANLEEENTSIFNQNVKAIKAAEAARPVMPSIPSIAERKEKGVGVKPRWRDYLNKQVNDEIENRVRKGEITEQEAEKIKQEIVKEVALDQEVTIVQQIEAEIMKELNKSITSGDLTEDKAYEIKYDIMKSVSKDFDLEGAAYLIETIKDLDDNLNKRVETGEIDKRQAEQWKVDMLRQIAEEDIDNIVTAAVKMLGLRKKAVKMAKKARMDYKITKYADNKKKKNLKKISKIVEEVAKEREQTSFAIEEEDIDEKAVKAMMDNILK